MRPGGRGPAGRGGERTFRETYAADTSPEDMEGYVASAYEPAAVERQLRDPESKFFLARVGGAAAGYLKVNRGGAQTELREEAGMEIESLYVLRRFQGGRLLLERALEEARERGAE